MKEDFTMNIVMLKDYPKFKEQVIEWINNEFGDKNSRNFYKSIIEHSFVDESLPITFVAVEKDELIGTVGIWRGDLLSRQEFYPWLSALVVNPDYRKKGVGQKLQKYVFDYCQSKGYKELYLYTDIEGYYEQNNWVQFDVGYEYSGDKIQIYKQNL